MRVSNIVAMASVATAIGAAAAARRAEDRAIRTFYDQATPEPTVREVLGLRIRLPFVYHRAEGFYALFPAALEPVRAALASPALHPVLTADGRATVAIGAYRYHDVTTYLADRSSIVVEPYAEMLIGPLVTTRRAPPLVELLPIPVSVFGLGVDVMHLPVTTRQARDGGLALFGLPKFVADMDFDDDLVERAVGLSEAGTQILTLAVRGGRGSTTDRSGGIGYGVLDGRLLEVSLRGVARVQRVLGVGGGRLALGSHPVADDLRRLGVEDRPIASVTELETRFYMGAGRPVGPGIAHEPYAAAERERGRYTVRHPGTSRIDQYADRDPDTGSPAPAIGSEQEERVVAGALTV